MQDAVHVTKMQLILSHYCFLGFQNFFEKQRKKYGKKKTKKLLK